MNHTAAHWDRRDTLLVILLAALVALAFWRILTPTPADRAQFPAGDFTDQFYAFRLYEARAFAEGRIPLWSENYNSGHPFLADIQSAVFYPVALVNTLANVWTFNSFSLFALELEALLHFWLAGAFTYLFARRIWSRLDSRTTQVGGVEASAGYSRNHSEPANASTPTFIIRVAAFTSAIVFTFGGYLSSYPSLQLAILETAAWLPLALYLIDRAFVPTTRRDNRFLIGAGLVLGVAALAGHPQTFLFVLGVNVIYFLFLEFQTTPRESRRLARVVAPIAALVLIAFGIAALQFVPAVEYQQLSTREALSFADAAKGFPTLDLLQLILPGYASAFASPLYVGILPLWLALFALLRRGRERYFWGLLALGALILSLGFYVFAYVVFYLFVPGASLFRQQERLAFIVSFALAMLAGYGIRDLLQGIDLRAARRLFPLLPAGAVITLALMLAFFVAAAQNPAGRLTFLGDRAGLMLLLFALTSLLVGLCLKNILGVRVFALLAVVLILFDLWSVSEPANKGRAQDRFADLPFVPALQADAGIFRVAAQPQLLPGHFGIPARLEEIGGISPLRLARYDAVLQLPPRAAYSLLNVKYLIARGGSTSGAHEIARDGDLTLSQWDTPMPRAWLVGSAIIEPDDAQAAAQLTSDFDVLQSALVASAPPFPPDPRAASGSVTISERAAEHMTLDVNAPADGLLIVSENFYPGWRATVDGQPIEILRADLTLRAISVRAGQRRIELTYAPLTFPLGAGITVLTLLVSLAGIYYIGKRDSSDQAHTGSN